VKKVTFWPGSPIYNGIIINVHNVHQMSQKTLFEPELSSPDMVSRPACGNMFLANACIKPFALLMKPTQSLTT
jgi:hypothetical protein